MKKVDEGCDLFDEIYLKGKPLWSWIVGLELAAVILDFDNMRLQLLAPSIGFL